MLYPQQVSPYEVLYPTEESPAVATLAKWWAAPESVSLDELGEAFNAAYAYAIEYDHATDEAGDNAEVVAEMAQTIWSAVKYGVTDMLIIEVEKILRLRVNQLTNGEVK